MVVHPQGQTQHKTNLGKNYIVKNIIIKLKGSQPGHQSHQLHMVPYKSHQQDPNYFIG